jgi:hypothetical protein
MLVASMAVDFSRCVPRGLQMIACKRRVIRNRPQGDDLATVRPTCGELDESSKVLENLWIELQKIGASFFVPALEPEQSCDLK